MGRASNIANLFKDVKTRTIIIFTGILLAIAIGVGLTGLSKKTGQQVEAGASTIKVPSETAGIGSGDITSPQYLETLSQANVQKAQEARTTGGSAIPSIVDLGQSFDTDDDVTGSGRGGDKDSLAGRGGSAAAAGEADGEYSANDYGGLTPEQVAMLRQQHAAMAAQLAAEQAQAKQLELLGAGSMQELAEQLQSSMANQSKAVLTSWASPVQTYTSGKLAEEGEDIISQSIAEALQGSGGKDSKGRTRAGNSADTDGGRALGHGGSKKADYKAGDIFFAVLDTSVNSDEAGPVLATIVGGSLRGAKLIGGLKPTKDGKRVMLSFNLVNVPDRDTSSAIDAVAIDPETARTALSSHTDNHYLTRYGALFASSFLEGLGQAAQDANTTTTVSDSGNITSFTDLNSGQQIIAALGQVGESWGEAIGDVVNRPPTVLVYSGTAVGVLLQTDLHLDGE